MLDSPRKKSNIFWYIHQHVGKGNAALKLIDDYIAFVINTLGIDFRKPIASIVIYNKMKNEDYANWLY